MADRGVEFSFFQDNHIRIDVIVDLSVSIRPMSTKFDKKVHLEELANF